MKNQDLKKRILWISYKLGLSHIGSCINAVDIIDHIYSIKKENEVFVLSSGHAALAEYVVIEKYGGERADFLFYKSGVHPTRLPQYKLYTTTGSLGHGLGIALGRAMANREKNVYCLISDGECAEGAIWKALTIKHNHNVTNLKVFVTANGYGAYGKVKQKELEDKINAFDPKVKVIRTGNDNIPFLKRLDAHYYVMKDEDWKWVEENL